MGVRSAVFVSLLQLLNSVFRIIWQTAYYITTLIISHSTLIQCKPINWTDNELIKHFRLSSIVSFHVVYPVLQYGALFVSPPSSGFNRLASRELLGLGK